MHIYYKANSFISIWNSLSARYAPQKWFLDIGLIFLFFFFNFLISAFCNLFANNSWTDNCFVSSYYTSLFLSFNEALASKTYNLRLVIASFESLLAFSITQWSSKVNKRLIKNLCEVFQKFSKYCLKVSGAGI